MDIVQFAVAAFIVSSVRTVLIVPAFRALILRHPTFPQILSIRAHCHTIQPCTIFRDSNCNSVLPRSACRGDGSQSTHIVKLAWNLQTRHAYNNHTKSIEISSKCNDFVFDSGKFPLAGSTGRFLT
jgi:hypothetical protein